MDASRPTTSKVCSAVYCGNPLGKPNHQHYRKNLRPVSKNLLLQNNMLKTGDKICDSCRKAIQKFHSEAAEHSSSPSDSSNEQEAEARAFPSETTGLSTPEKVQAIEALNRSLQCLDETPIKKKRLQEKKYPEQKYKKAQEAFRTKLLNLSPALEPKDIPSSEPEIISQLKEKFHSVENKSIRMQILTTLPNSWSLKRIEIEFGVSNFMARKAKKLVKEKGIMSSPDPKPGKTLDKDTANLIQEFYESEDVSRQMPGKKDFVSVKTNNKRQHVQKKLLLSNLHELYTLFKERFPRKKVGFSKFCELRPKHCVLAGASGTHSVCVCTMHQNATLMMAQCKLPELTGDTVLQPINSYKDVLANIICGNPTPACYFSQCNNCPGLEELKKRFEDCFDLNSIENVTFKQWMQLEKRTVLETLSKSTQEFLDLLFGKLPALLHHSFIATQQSCYLRHLKDTVTENQYIVICDFAENYSFVLQDAAQGFHWNNAQATLHPIVIYYRDEKTQNLGHVSFVIISDCLIHDSIAVHLFQRYLINFMQSHFSQKPEKIFYFSDGAASQYKNKSNFLNLCYHEADFNIKAEWNFFATAHGKNACDGIGGTVKRLAAKASLRLVYNDQIMTPRQLFEWASANIASIHFQFATKENYKEEAIILKSRITYAKTISGTQKLHCFIPAGNHKLLVKAYSLSEHFKEEICVTDEAEENMSLENMVGFVISQYSEHWWLGCVLGVNEDTEEVKVSFLEPHGPSPSYKYPQTPDILLVHKSDVLLKVDPTTATGRVYNLTITETKKANQALAYKCGKI